MRKVTLINKTQKIVDVIMGKGVKIYDFVNAYDCKIGDGTKIGAF
ncbi:N-acetyltransferase, partial [Candidatus Roizmanbacteria bacterium]|nr:N-acetyltransferase [Candidatus Roizmanbacteria bacterium]